MKVQQKINDKVNSFTFTCNILEGKKLDNILKLFRINEIYLCIYGLRKDRDIFNKTFEVEDISFSSSRDFALRINTIKLSILLPRIVDCFDELSVWSCYTNWKGFLNDMKNLPFVYSKKQLSSGKDEPSFYLNYNPFNSNNVEIICDLSFNNCLSIKKEDIMGVLN